MRAEAEHIAISKSKGIQIDWKDGHRSAYTLAYLRDECPCATCTGAHGTVPQKTNYSAEEAKPANPFKMYTPTLKMLKVEEVGAYAATRGGWLESVLAGMEEGLRGALRERARLAALGSGVARINHDLRNILASEIPIRFDFARGRALG
mgnify:CR=1 FL=1